MPGTAPRSRIAASKADGLIRQEAARRRPAAPEASFAGLAVLSAVQAGARARSPARHTACVWENLRWPLEQCGSCRGRSLPEAWTEWLSWNRQPEIAAAILAPL